MAIPGTDLLRVPTIYKAYASGLCTLRGFFPQNMWWIPPNQPWFLWCLHVFTKPQTPQLPKFHAQHPPQPPPNSEASPVLQGEQQHGLERPKAHPADRAMDPNQLPTWPTSPQKNCGAYPLVVTYSLLLKPWPSRNKWVFPAIASWCSIVFEGLPEGIFHKSHFFPHFSHAST